MTDDTISPLRRRMIEDMTVRGFAACTQRGCIAAVRRFTDFLGRSPDQATAEDRLAKCLSGQIACCGGCWFGRLVDAGVATMNVADWLRSLGLEQYESAFRENELTGRCCPS